jgi:hypothetical protein
VLGHHPFVDGEPAVANEVGELDVLFGQQYGKAARPQRLDGVRHPQHHDGRQPFAGFVQQQHPRTHGQRAPDRHHLALAARQLAGVPAFQRRQFGEQAVDLGQDLLPGPADGQVLGHGQRLEQAPAAGDDGQPRAHPPVRGQRGQFPARQRDAAGGLGQQAGQGVQERGFPGPVPAHQPHRLPFPHGDARAADDFHVAVARVQAGHAQDIFRCPRQNRPP